jgi:integrase/recombinase XerD
LNDIKTLLRTVWNIGQARSEAASYTYKSIGREIMVLELSFATGIRVSELCNLKKGDPDSMGRRSQFFYPVSI